MDICVGAACKSPWIRVLVKVDRQNRNTVLCMVATACEGTLDFCLRLAFEANSEIIFFF